MRDEAMNELLARVQRELTCPVCKRSFDIDEIRVRGAIDNHVLVQASCQRNHHPSLVLYVAGNHDHQGNDNGMTSDDVLDLHQQLKQFNGDFRTMFKSLGEQQS